MKYGASMTHLLLCVLCFLGGTLNVSAVRYADYSVNHMPQYNDQHEDSEVASGAEGHDEYSVRSPDASAHLDYKYEEESHGKPDDLLVKDIIDEGVWDKPIKKKRKPSRLRSGHNRDVHTYNVDETEPEVISDKRFPVHRSEFRKRIHPKRSESLKHLKHITIDHSDDIDNVENNSDYIHKENVERPDGDDTMEMSHFRYRSTTQRKPRRKARDRAFQQQEWRGSNNNVKLELDEGDSRSERDNFAMKIPRGFGESIQPETINRKNKNNYDYDDYYDMKRVQHMKSRLPALLQQTTVRTTETKSKSYSEHWLNRRAPASAAGQPVLAELTSLPAATNTTAAVTTTTVGTTSETKSAAGNSSDLSLAEKSRLSILRKAQRKESWRNVSWSTKPPVLMQVTRQMQTLVMVEGRRGGAGGAREVGEDSPERLRRARRLVRHKLVAGARSIHDLIDNWDEMICDYIDVSLLDTDAASHLDVDAYLTVLILIFYTLISSDSYLRLF